jgi:hypothetical protein
LIRSFHRGELSGFFFKLVIPPFTLYFSWLFLARDLPHSQTSTTTCIAD